MAINIEMNILQSNGTTYETLYPKTSASNLEGILSSSQLPSSIPASNISGTLSTSNIPNLSASKITSGTLSVFRGGTGVTSLKTLAEDLSQYLSDNLTGLTFRYSKQTKAISTSQTIILSNTVLGLGLMNTAFYIICAEVIGTMTFYDKTTEQFSLSNRPAIFIPSSNGFIESNGHGFSTEVQIKGSSSFSVTVYNVML